MSKQHHRGSVFSIAMASLIALATGCAVENTSEPNAASEGALNDPMRARLDVRLVGSWEGGKSEYASISFAAPEGQAQVRRYEGAKIGKCVVAPCKPRKETGQWAVTGSRLTLTPDHLPNTSVSYELGDVSSTALVLRDAETKEVRDELTRVPSAGAQGFTCTDHGHRYILQDLTPSPNAKSATIKFIDTFERRNVELSCGIDDALMDGVEYACSGASPENKDIVVRARIHAVRDSQLPRIALIEVQKDKSIQPTINDTIPLICK